MKVYIVNLQYSTDEIDGLDIEVFSTYKKAVKRFNEIIETEKQPGMSWVADAYENGELLYSYELDASPKFSDGEEHELWWNLTCKADWSIHEFLQLRIVEVK